MYDRFRWDIDNDTMDATLHLMHRLKGAVYEYPPRPTRDCADAAAALFEMGKGSLSPQSDGAQCLMDIVSGAASAAIYDLCDGDENAWSNFLDSLTDDPTKFQILRRRLMQAWDTLREFEDDLDPQDCTAPPE